MRREGGSPVKPVERSGFGSKTIERAMTAELGAKEVSAYQIPGVTCIITAPLYRLILASSQSGGT
ncbi:hypothetical protein DSM25558_1404 [Agrobacterium sp. DSM 25558]|uniref:Uncharacterized protein n=1 Tax=Agrobacterium rosae TaxID=1972867 RepID=A0A1R3TWC1_9HYPH|nr:hypothetical protein DSM25558_1404 [Agrobacterium sp. DSM 25558]SCX22946.1 hypothetical protein DSM25559_2296 [Agrobacterium rosae]